MKQRPNREFTFQRPERRLCFRQLHVLGPQLFGGGATSRKKMEGARLTSFNPRASREARLGPQFNSCSS
jgi:hypothetical protein